MARRERVTPAREYRDTDHSFYRETHPAFGQIAASRVSSTPGAALYGSDFDHGHYMTITIRRSEFDRSSLSSDYYHGTQEVIEVALSEAQWATFVSAPNMGLGVPCTIQYEAGKGYIEGIEPIEDRRTQFNREVAGRMQGAIDAVDDALGDVTLTKKQRAVFDRIKMALSDGLPWVAKQFDEHAETTVERAKMEVNAYITQALMRAGVAALNEGAPIEIRQLSSGNDDTLQSQDRDMDLLTDVVE